MIENIFMLARIMPELIFITANTCDHTEKDKSMVLSVIINYLVKKIVFF